jgi:hypothetical protein
MRSALHDSHRRRNSFINGIVEVVADVASALMLLGDLIAPRSHTVKKSDHSEPPDLGGMMQPA